MWLLHFTHVLIYSLLATVHKYTLVFLGTLLSDVYYILLIFECEKFTENGAKMTEKSTWIMRQNATKIDYSVSCHKLYTAFELPALG